MRVENHPFPMFLEGWVDGDASTITGVDYGTPTCRDVSCSCVLLRAWWRNCLPRGVVSPVHIQAPRRQGTAHIPHWRYKWRCERRPTAHQSHVQHELVAGVRSPLRSLERIPDYFLNDCSGLKKLDLNPFSNVKSMGQSFLGECRSLTKVNLAPRRFLRGSFSSAAV